MVKAGTLVVILVVALLGLSQHALAAAPITVGNGTAASCTEAALRNLLIVAGAEGGGRIHFDCGEAPVTIAVTETLTIPDKTRIDGGGLITLDGQYTTIVFRVDRDSAVELRHLSVSRGGCRYSSCEGPGGGILNEGVLIVDDSTFASNFDFLGGAISNQGTLTIHRSRFIENIAGRGGAIQNAGTLRVYDSTFCGNFAAADFGGGIFNKIGRASCRERV